MAITKKKSLNILLAFTLLVSLFIPYTALAYDTKGDPNNPTLTIHKKEQEPKTPEGEEGTGLPGQNAEGKEVEGVTYTLTLEDKYNAEEDKWEKVTNKKTITGITNKNGQVVFTQADGLELGRYKVEETAGPDHVILNPGSFYVDVPMTSKDGKTLNYDVHVYPKNETIRSDVELIKKDENGNPLEGVSFKLYNADGTPAVDNKNQEVPELITGADGKISVTGLAAGKYYFQETKAPKGYTLNTTKIPFEVKKTGEKGQEITVEWTNVDGIADNGQVTNYNTPEITKDVEGKEISDMDRDKEYKYNLTIKTPKDIDKYKAIGVSDTLDDRLTFVNDGSLTDGWDVEGTDKSNVTFIQKGQTLIWEIDPSKLSPGQEVKITFTAKIKPDAVLEDGETGISNTADLHFNNGKGSYTKPADPDNPGPYEPYDPEDPNKPTETPDPEDPSTPKNPPVVVPTEGGMKIIKVQKGNLDNKLQGAEFKLTTDKEGNNVVDAKGTIIKVNGESFSGNLENLVTDENGEIVIEGLTPGTYYLHETKAPIDEKDGKPYRLLTKPIQVEIENNKTKNKDITVENSKSGWELPTTGGIGTILFTIIGLALMITAFVLYVRRRQSVA